ncbi:MAG TPA: hypothetical protein VM694_18675 [Polyangium sp.]|nr:hypothetical protein [Polyangium sp.]
MDAITRRTALAELQARIRAAEARGVDQSARLVRSIQQSFRVEGYEVREQVVLDALQRFQKPVQS